MVDLNKILSERSDDRILSAIRRVSESEFRQLVELVLGCLSLKVVRSRAKADFVIADCVHRPDDVKYIVFFSRRSEDISRQSIDSLTNYMKRVGAPHGLAFSTSSIMPDAVKAAGANDVGVADGPKLAALIRRFDLDRSLIREADLSNERERRASVAGLDETVAKRMADGHDAFSRRDYVKALECFDHVISIHEGYDVAWRVKANVLDAMGYHEQALECYRRAIDLNSGGEETWFALGNCLFSLSRHEDELKCYERALEINPAHQGALVNKGYTLHRLGRYREALDVYDEVLTRNYRLEKVHNNRGVTLHKLGRNDEALESYDRALSLKSDYSEAWLNRGSLLHEMGRDEEAFESFVRLTELRPDSAKAWYLRGALAAELGRRTQARMALEESLRRDPHYSSARELLGSVEDVAEMTASDAPRIMEEILAPKPPPMQAVEVVEAMEVVSEEPAEAPPPPEVAQTEPWTADVVSGVKEESVDQLAEELYGDRAELLLLLGRLDEAHDFIGKSLRLEGDNPRLLTAAGNVLFKQGKYEPAIKTYEHAFAVDPAYAPALFNLHMALMVAGETDLALKVSESLRDMGNGWQARTASAIEAQRRGDFRQALEDVEVALAAEGLAMLVNFKGVLQLLSQDVDSSIETFGRLVSSSFDPSEANSNLGVARLRKGDISGSATDFDKAIRMRKSNPVAWNNRGCVLYREERLREAIACFEESLVINPTAVAMTNKGFCQLSLDMLEEAAVTFDQSIRISETAEAYNNKGIAMRRQGRIDEAVVAFREALRIAPQFEDTNSNLREAIARQSAMRAKKEAEKAESKAPPKDDSDDDLADKVALVKHETEGSLKGKRKTELEAICIALGISSKGAKRDLVSRILKARRRLLRK
ncbi:TPA: tetratricopeptide repeat protein [Thermoplasmata archaeon]|nr:tetratricopeptide repeat protein [Thermoplasmata archaeon]